MLIDKIVKVITMLELGNVMINFMHMCVVSGEYFQDKLIFLYL